MQRRALFAFAPPAMAQTYVRATRGFAPIKITDVRVICTNPPYRDGSVSHMQRLVITKVITSEPGLYGLGCASFVLRPGAVMTFTEKYLKPFVLDKDPDMVSDLYQSMNASSLWRGGPVENYAVAGVDMALWDIKAKRAGMPLYELLGGKMRAAIHCYGDAAGKTGSEMTESVQKALANGYTHVRLNYGGLKVDPTPALAGMPLGSSSVLIR
ncbi:MAG: hypothetical protein WKF37_18865 [Bryobacteraceae bacterium]